MLISVVTKDSTERLLKTLRQFKNIRYPVILFDDSYSSDIISSNKQICRENNVVYHGLSEQLKFLGKINDSSIDKFMRPFGGGEWNLGYNRNYILFFAIKNKYHKTLILDDDIILKNISDLEYISDLLDKNSFVASSILGMPDDSIVGHLFRDNGLIQFQYHSCSCLGIKLPNVTNFFLNEYNEDWIWLFLENFGIRCSSSFEVFQIEYNPYDRISSMLLFQEKGEILWEGVQMAISKGSLDLLELESFWELVCKHRYEQIMLIDSFTKPNKQILAYIKFELLSNIIKASPNEFASIWREYFDKKKLWIRILN
jgi:hypothetical protein